MHAGLIEYAVTEFPGSKFNGAIAPALKKLVDEKVIRIVDMALVHKDGDGGVEAVEFENLDDPDYVAAFRAVEGEIGGLLNEEDIAELAEDLEPGTSATILVWENLWASELAEAVRGSGGRLVAHGTVDPEAFEEAVAALGETSPAAP
jgi:uncharacterized membrane protein